MNISAISSSDQRRCRGWCSSRLRKPLGRGAEIIRGSFVNICDRSHKWRVSSSYTYYKLSMIISVMLNRYLMQNWYQYRSFKSFLCSLNDIVCNANSCILIQLLYSHFYWNRHYTTMTIITIYFAKQSWILLVWEYYRITETRIFHPKITIPNNGLAQGSGISSVRYCSLALNHCNFSLFLEYKTEMSQNRSSDSQPYDSGQVTVQCVILVLNVYIIF